MIKKIILPLWILAAISLFLYSFTQVDLFLTLSRAEWWQSVQKAFQYVGYYQRPLSTYLFIGIILFLFCLYLLTLRLISNNSLSKNSFWTIVVVISGILFLSYNAFSYDLFNYIFDARIVTHYQQNPYFHKALDYPTDPMLHFMHWTHRTYPYGPVWLLLTIPVSFIGFGYFLLTLYFFKLLMLASFIGSVKLIEKIAEMGKFKNPLFITAAFALNPLVIIESLVSSHNDIVMIFFTLLSIYFLFKQKKAFSLFYFIFAFSIKFVNLFLLPAYLYLLKKKNSFEVFFMIATFSMAISVLLATQRTNFQPWYLLFVLPFAAFISRKIYILIPVVILSFAGLLNYAPYLYLGNWNAPVPTILAWINIGSIIFSLLIVICMKIFKSSTRN
jgi:hypothetical protein